MKYCPRFVDFDPGDCFIRGAQEESEARKAGSLQCAAPEVTINTAGTEIEFLQFKAKLTCNDLSHDKTK